MVTNLCDACNVLKITLQFIISKLVFPYTLCALKANSRY